MYPNLCKECISYAICRSLLLDELNTSIEKNPGRDLTHVVWETYRLLLCKKCALIIKDLHDHVYVPTVRENTSVVLPDIYSEYILKLLDIDIEMWPI